MKLTSLFFTLLLLAGIASAPTGVTINLSAGGDLQGAINTSNCGDAIVLQKGATWDGTFTYAKNCTAANPLTIRSSGVLALARVAPSDAANMPRIRSLGGGQYGAVIQAGTNAGGLVLDGLEITDNAPTSATINMLLDFSVASVHDITVQRCYIHQKETGTNYNRTAQRAIQFEGVNLISRWNYIYLIGYYYPEIQGGNNHYQMDTTALLSVGQAKQILWEDNYVSVWWNQIFLGGADADPQNAASLTNATTGSATFSNTTGLTAGVTLRLEFTITGNFDRTGFNSSCNGGFPANGSAPFSTGSVTRSSGAILSSADAIRYGKIKNATENELLIGLCAVAANTYTIAATRSTSVPSSGPTTMTIYETATVTSVVGNTVNYTPLGVNSVASAGATSASWNYGDQGLVSDVTVRKNTFYVDPVFAHDVYLKTSYSPKGLYELKNVNRFDFYGNYVLGYPAGMAVYPGNQYGTAPWTTGRHINIHDNWIAFDSGFPESTRESMMMVDASNYGTITPKEDIHIYNNLIKGVSSFATFKGADNVSANHNTVINAAPTTYGYTDAVTHIGGGPITRFNFSDNILAYSAYGLNCFIPPYSVAACFPAGVFQNNVIVNTSNTTAPSGGAINSSIWGTGSALMPVTLTFAGVGFTDMANDNYRLSATSPFKGKGSNGTDPGVDVDQLMAALGGAIPNPTPTPTPTPTPAPSPQPSPQPSPSPSPTPLVRVLPRNPSECIVGRWCYFDWPSSQTLRTQYLNSASVYYCGGLPFQTGSYFYCLRTVP